MSAVTNRALLRTYLRPEWPRFTALAILLMGGIALQLVGPQILSVFINTVSAGGAVTTLKWLGMVYLVVAGANLVVGVATTYLGQDVGWRTTNALRADLASHALRQDIAFHHLRTPGEFIERIDGDLTALANFFSVFIINVLGSALLLVGAIILIWLIDWRAGLALGGYVVLTLIALLVLRHFAVPAGVLERESSATFLGFLEERVAGIEDVRANGAGHYVLRRFYEVLRPWYHRSIGVWMRRSVIWSSTTMFFALGYTLMLGVAAALYFDRAISLGAAYLLFQYTLMMQRPLDLLTQQFQELQRSLASVVRARELFAFQPTICDGPALPSRVAGAASVAFDHVTFAYRKDEKPVLSDLDFCLAPGEILGLLGRTGSGKTTISRLLFRLYEVETGAVLLDGVDVRQLRLGDLRRRVGLVTQDVQLFHATIRDNLTFFDPAISDDQIHQAIATLGLGDWFARLPAGLDSEVSSGGGGLSAGEAQLIAFVRVFLRDPGLVILDEPSARLDPATEALIDRGVAALLRGRTAIIIAHRLGTVRRADTIMVLDHGAMVEYGLRQALVDDPTSRFAELLRVGLDESVSAAASPAEVTA